MIFLKSAEAKLLLTPLGLKTAILAEKRIDSFARIDGRADWELVLKGTLTTAAGTGTFLGGILAIGGSSGLAFI